MSVVSLKGPVRLLDGVTITTIAELADRGEIKFEKFKTETRKRLGERHERMCYLATHTPTGSCWEIRATAYASRTGEKVEIKAKPPQRGQWGWGGL